MRSYLASLWFISLTALAFTSASIAAIPASPQNMRVTVNSPYSVLVEWDASANANENTRYALTRNGASIGVHKETKFLDNALLPERTFVYEVIAQDILGQRSAVSAVSVTTPARPPSQQTALTRPQAPTGFRLERYSENSLELFWDRVTSEFLHYEVSRNNQLIAQTDGVSFFDNLPVVTASYTYQLVAIDVLGNRSSSISVSINSPSSPAVPQSTSNGTLENPGNPTLAIYSSTAAELFWTRQTDQSGGSIRVEVYRDGVLLGQTDGTSFMDMSRTRQDHQYELVGIQNGQRSSGIQIPAESPLLPVETNSSTTSFISTVRPRLAALPDRGRGLDVFLLNGQSNANPQFLNAITEHLSARGFNYLSAHYYVGGQPLSTWITEDGTKALRWPIMMNVFDGATALCESSPHDIRSITLVHYQGEADVNTTETLIAVSDKTASPFKSRLTAFTREFTRHFEERCGMTPNIALAIISFDEQHSLFPSRLREAHALIRKDISDVAREQSNIGAFDTFDLEHADHVHLKLYPGSQAQFIAAERAINLFYTP